MRDVKNVKIKIHSYIENLDSAGLRDGEPEVNDSEHTALLTLMGDELYISYEENSEGGKIASDIHIMAENKITVCRRGAIESVLLFADGEVFNTLYTIPPYKFDMQVKTLRIRNSLSVDGGSLDILYSMTVGGASKKCRMKISVSEVMQ